MLGLEVGVAVGAVRGGDWGEGLAVAPCAGRAIGLAVEAVVTAGVVDQAGAIAEGALPFGQDLASSAEAIEDEGCEGLGHG